MGTFKIPWITDSELLLKTPLAIVGNSGALIGSNKGEEINSHDEVVRCNYGTTGGHEKDVGIKETLRILSDKATRCIADQRHPYEDYKFCSRIANKRLLILRAPADKLDQSNEIHRLDYWEMLKCYEDKYSQLTKPTIGMIMTLVCIEAGIVPTLYGIDLNRRDRDHYYGKRSTEVTYHDVDEEIGLWHQWRRDNKLKVGHTG